MKGNVMRRLAHPRAFQQQVAVAQIVAVIGGEDDHRVFVETLLGKRIENAAYRIVDHGDHSARQRHRLQAMLTGSGDRLLVG